MTDLDSVARIALAWITAEARKGYGNPGILDRADAAQSYAIRALDAVNMTADEAGTLLGYADEAHRDARDTLKKAAHALLAANADDDDTANALDAVRLACQQATQTRAVRLALRDRNTGASER